MLSIGVRRFGIIVGRDSRTIHTGTVARGLEEFFERGQRLPNTKEPTGRAWEASELRQKSWEDLQKLWYVTLKERNLLASQVEEGNRLSIPEQFFSNKGRIIKCKKTMARIKTVLGERQKAWEKAQQEMKEKSKSAPVSNPAPAPAPSEPVEPSQTV